MTLLTNFDRQLIQLALQEDMGLPYYDATSQILFSDGEMGQASIYSKHPQPIIFCGEIFLKEFLELFFPDCQVEFFVHDGQIVSPQNLICKLTGPRKHLLMLERCILNFLQRLCAIATLTRDYVERVKNTALKILDTRKTAPGMRHLEKYAVQCGGGVNHRMGLYDAIMVKDTHIDLLGGLEKVFAQFRRTASTISLPIIIEVRTPCELQSALKVQDIPITRVLLDNMPLTMLAECVKMCQGKVATEASGNISLENILDIAQTGVQYASVGKLTHSAGVVDLSMQCG